MSAYSELIDKARAAIKPTDSIELVRAFEYLAAESDSAKDERLVRYMAMVTPLGYQSALTVVVEMSKLLAAEEIARAAIEAEEPEGEVEYRVFDWEGELWASTNSLDEARHYLAQDPSGFARIERAVWVPVEQGGE